MIDIEKEFTFHEHDIIVVGCSTGPDSMALLDCLLKIREKYQLNIIVAHVNHNIRKQSIEEEKFLKDYCQNCSLIFEGMIIDHYGDDNFHNEARSIRYRFFEEIVDKYQAHYLMTAHHGDDLMETILMRIVRGSNLNGYSGFKKIVDMGDYKIIRPFITYTKKELEEYDVLNHVPYYIDESNGKDTYTRNRYRKYVLPFLKEEDKDVHHKFLKFSNTLYEANQFIEEERDKVLERVFVQDKLIIDKFLLENRYLQREVLYYILSKYYEDDLILVNDKHIDLILQFIYSNKVNGFVNLPNDVIAKREYNTLSIVLDVDSLTSYEIEFDKNVQLPNGHSIEQIEDTDDNSNSICRLCSSEIALPLIVRTRRVGDKMHVKGLNGSQKIKDIFIDKKVSKENRDLWPIVCDSLGNIVWIPGIKKSKFDKKKIENYDIILKYN